MGLEGPVLLDAECAWFGDPAFDVAFCLTHLILKTVARPDRSAALLDSGRALVSSYLGHVAWEEPEHLLQRVVTLVPALLLARIDGSSPVEYITAPRLRAAVRRTAAGLLAEPAGTLHDLLGRVDGVWSGPRHLTSEA
ncbi:MAG: hypothetical protein JO037_24945 [Actinobacteria bacterium]|nr:hypothetical protein [Actinomycetota bacterium]